MTNAIEKNTERFVILSRISKSVAAVGPDLIVYDKVDDAIKFLENKAWMSSSTTTFSGRVTWINSFKIESYVDEITSGAAKLPANVRAKVLAALKRDPVLVITGFASNLTKVGPKWAKQGVQFLSARQLASRGASSSSTSASLSKAFGCGISISASAFTLLTTTRSAYAAEPMSNKEMFNASLDKLFDTIRQGGPYGASIWAPYSANGNPVEARDIYRLGLSHMEIKELHEDFIQRGILRFERGSWFRDGSYYWHDELSLGQLDYINEKIRMEEIVGALNGILLAEESGAYSLSPN